MLLRAIGYVECDASDATPADGWTSVESRIVLDPSYRDGLQGLVASSDIVVVFWFHRSGRFELRQHPRGDPARPRRGVFSLCSPHRPNPIGVSRVRLLGIEGNVLRVRGLDAIDGTPVIDIKPSRI